MQTRELRLAIAILAAMLLAAIATAAFARSARDYYGKGCQLDRPMHGQQRN